MGAKCYATLALRQMKFSDFLFGFHNRMHMVEAIMLCDAICSGDISAACIYYPFLVLDWESRERLLGI